LLDLNTKSPANGPNVATRPSLRRRIQHLTGLDRAIGFTVLARGWSSLAGVVTVLLIARFLARMRVDFVQQIQMLVLAEDVADVGHVLFAVANQRALPLARLPQ